MFITGLTLPDFSDVVSMISCYPVFLGNIMLCCFPLVNMFLGPPRGFDPYDSPISPMLYDSLRFPLLNRIRYIFKFK